MYLKNHSEWFINLFRHFADLGFWKAAIAVVIGFLFDGLLAQAMMAILMLIVFDFSSAIICSKKCNIPIQSRLALRSAIKIAVYFLLVSAGRMAELSTSSVLSFLDEAVIAFLGLTELISIMENIGKMGYAIPMKLLNQLETFRDGIGKDDPKKQDETYGYQ